MAQNISILGATYSDVPAVELPKSGGGTASFTDVTDTTAAASDVASGKYFYTAAGVKTAGTASGGGATLITKSITQNGTYNASSDNADGYSSVTVNVSGGGEVAPNDVNFYDYDGTILYSYSAADFANLSALPANPTHTGLTAQGWNWSLSDAKTYVASYGMLDIGQMYITDNGKTRIYIQYPDFTADAARTMQVRFKPSVANGVMIDWGDGNTSTSNSTNLTDYTHVYGANGEYVITLTATSGTTYELQGANTESIIGETTNAGSYKQIYLKRVEVGGNITKIGANTFNNQLALESVTLPRGTNLSGDNIFAKTQSLRMLIIPDGATGIGNYFVTEAYCLKRVSLPKTITTIGTYFCQQLRNLERLAIPPNVTSIDGYVCSSCSRLQKVIIPSGIPKLNSNSFNGCQSLSLLIIPESVTEIGGSVFNSTFWTKIIIPKNVASIGNNFARFSYGLRELYMYPTTPPTLGSNPFGSITSSLKIYVPNGKLSDYQSDSNWSNYASYMVEMSA